MKKYLSAALISMLVFFSCSKKDDVVDNIPAVAAAPLSAGFTITNQQMVLENTVAAQFSNTSVSAVSYLWDFGTGDVSTEKEPVYMYLGCGPKTVTLTVTDAAGNKKTFSTEFQVLCTGKHAPQTGH